MPGPALPALVALATLPARSGPAPPPQLSAEVRQYRVDLPVTYGDAACPPDRPSSPDLARVAWARDGLQLRGSLVLLRRSGSEPVTIAEAGRHIVFTVRRPVPQDPFGLLAPAQQRTELPLVITATRCDGHALSSNSRNNVFTFYVAVGDAEPLQTATTADAALQGELERLARDTCSPG